MQEKAACFRHQVIMLGQLVSTAAGGATTKQCCCWCTARTAAGDASATVLPAATAGSEPVAATNKAPVLCGPAAVAAAGDHSPLVAGKTEKGEFGGKARAGADGVAVALALAVPNKG